MFMKAGGGGSYPADGPVSPAVGKGGDPKKDKKKFGKKQFGKGGSHGGFSKGGGVSSFGRGGR